MAARKKSAAKKVDPAPPVKSTGSAEHRLEALKLAANHESNRRNPSRYIFKMAEEFAAYIETGKVPDPPA